MYVYFNFGSDPWEFGVVQRKLSAESRTTPMLSLSK